MNVAIRCTEVWIQFRNNKPGQRITRGDANMACHWLAVKDDGERVQIGFLDEANQTRKLLVFPYEVIQEFCLEGIEGKPLRLPEGTPKESAS